MDIDTETEIESDINTDTYAESRYQTPDGYTPQTGRPPANRDRAEGENEMTDDLEALLVALPPALLRRLQAIDDRANLLEIVMDLGRAPEARYHGREMLLSEEEISAEDIEYVVNRIGNFGEDNRAGIERTLHRISCLRNRNGKVVGLTCRIGRAVFGTMNIIRDLVESGKSILLLGPPGVGKTTLLREVARVLADEARKRVVIVDTSNEIAGDGDIPHPAIGRARRMQVPSPSRQHAVMIEAVENHMPEVIVIDEIGTELEASAARTIAERGVQLVGTAHGSTLENLMLNPTLSDLIGGIQSVTLGDEEARRRGTQKSVLERKAPPTFDVMVEILDRDRVAVHLDVAEVVDAILRGQGMPPEIRERLRDGRIETRPGQFEPQRDGGRPGLSNNGNGRSHDRGNDRGNDRGDRGDRGRDGRRGGREGREGRGSGRASQVGNGNSSMAMSMAATAPGPTRSMRGSADYADRGDRRPPLAAPSNYPQPRFVELPDEEYEDEEDIVEVSPFAANEAASNRTPASPGSTAKPLRVYPFGVSRDRLEQTIGMLNVPVTLTKDISDSDVVVTLKNYYRKKPSALRQAEEESLPVYVLKSNTSLQMQQVLASLFDLPEPSGATAGEEDPVTTAIYETEAAITQTLETGRSVELPPANAYIRRLQHQMAERYNLGSQSRGREPNRRVLIYRQD